MLDLCLSLVFINPTKKHTPQHGSMHADSLQVCNTKTLRSFGAKFGACPNVCCDFWERLQSRRPKCVMPKHLLWGILFLKVYGTEDILRNMVGATRKTFHKWSWKIVEIVRDMEAEVVSVCTF
jgi:hypothetical protein